MALRGLTLTWVCIASLFISCSIILLFKFKNSTFLLFPKHFSFCFYVPANCIYSKQTSKTFRGTGYRWGCNEICVVCNHSNSYKPWLMLLFLKLFFYGCGGSMGLYLVVLWWIILENRVNSFLVSPFNHKNSFSLPGFSCKCFQSGYNFTSILSPGIVHE